MLDSSIFYDIQISVYENVFLPLSSFLPTFIGDHGPRYSKIATRDHLAMIGTYEVLPFELDYDIQRQVKEKVYKRQNE